MTSQVRWGVVTLVLISSRQMGQVRMSSGTHMSPLEIPGAGSMQVLREGERMRLRRGEKAVAHFGDVPHTALVLLVSLESKKNSENLRY